MPAFDKRVSDFEAVNTQVLGISTDSPFSHENWAKAVGISHYPLLSDVHRTVAKDYGVYWPDWNANSRASFVIVGLAAASCATACGARSTSRPACCAWSPACSVSSWSRWCCSSRWASTVAG